MKIMVNDTVKKMALSLKKAAKHCKSTNDYLRLAFSFQFLKNS